jgi:hypothetical protein
MAMPRQGGTVRKEYGVLLLFVQKALDLRRSETNQRPYGGLLARYDRMIQEYLNDPYFLREKYQDPSICRGCKVVFHDGKFEWMDKMPDNAQEVLCPVCKRIGDSYEGGHVVLKAPSYPAVGMTWSIASGRRSRARRSRDPWNG